MRKHTFLVFTLALLLFSACKKDKLDYTYDDRNTNHAERSSNVRLVNLGAGSQLIANVDDTLTNFVVRDPLGPLADKYPPTRYFPTDGRLGKTWNVPQDLFNGDNRLDLTLGSKSFQGVNDPDDRKFTVEDDPNNPTDYYLVNTVFTQGVPNLLSVPRDVTSPSRPDYFKVRIINLTGKPTNPANGVSGAQENLDGPITLAFADGTNVSGQTTNISTDQRASDYIELPYGAYQFRVLTSDGRQIPGAPSGSDLYGMRYLNPPTSTLDLRFMTTSNLTFTPMQQYLAGGIYTIVVTPREFRYFVNEMDEDVTTYQNAFEVIADNSPSANTTYGRIQGVNAFSNQGITFRANGSNLPGQLAFGESGEYKTLVHGQYRIEAVDANGNVLATTDELLRAAQNYTAWLYPDVAGNAKIALVANDLSGTRYSNTGVGAVGDDATYGRQVSRFPFHKRFLNLSPDNPYITFTQANGQSISGLAFGGAEMNLQPGIPVVTQPYLSSATGLTPFYFLAYRSAPDVIPGTWANDIAQLNADSFIARKELYTQANRALPVQEAGIYTVALIGRSGNNVPTALNARMIVVKHNR